MHVFAGPADVRGGGARNRCVGAGHLRHAHSISDLRSVAQGVRMATDLLMAILDLPAGCNTRLPHLLLGWRENLPESDPTGNGEG